jgi:ATP-dependent exoDNAse (exonuclease V) beta subunit
MDEASRYIEALRPVGHVRTAITRSFRSVRELLLFVNDMFSAIDKAPARPDGFRYSEDDAFPVTRDEPSESDALSVVAARSDEQQAEAVAGEIARLLLEGATVRDRDSGLRRPVQPGDIAILFRTRDGHQLFEAALARRHVPYYVYKGLGFFDADEIKDVLALLAFLARPESELNAAAFLRSRFVRLSDEALKLLAPHLGAALADMTVPACYEALHPDDRRRLDLARRAVPRWLTLVDRLPPSELLDRVLSESAYAAEIRGTTYRQARENLKKVRSLVRRIHNRGYATLERIVDHFSQLVAGGDESNAIIDAIEAVNLMTIHAAKGLEFPIVFVVNLQRGSGGSADPIRVFASPPGPDESTEPTVSIGEHQTAGDRDSDAREAEESKRLLYVALTRARDRLCLAATLGADDRFVPGKGGLGRTLPPAFGALLTAAAQSSETHAIWPGVTARHLLRIVREPEMLRVMSPHIHVVEDRIDDLRDLEPDGPRRIAVTALVDEPVLEPTPGPIHSSVEAGVLVHRALARNTDRIEDLLREEERAQIDDVNALIAHARRALRSIRRHPDVEAVFGEAAAVRWRRHEVAFSHHRENENVVVRGTIDCVVQLSSGSLQVLEFKTGRPLREHAQQLDAYVAAAKALFPGASVEGKLIYAD